MENLVKVLFSSLSFVRCECLSLRNYSKLINPLFFFSSDYVWRNYLLFSFQLLIHLEIINIRQYRYDMILLLLCETAQEKCNTNFQILFWQWKKKQSFLSHFFLFIQFFSKESLFLQQTLTTASLGFSYNGKDWHIYRKAYRFHNQFSFLLFPSLFYLFIFLSFFFLWLISPIILWSYFIMHFYYNLFSFFLCLSF